MTASQETDLRLRLRGTGPASSLAELINEVFPEPPHKSRPANTVTSACETLSRKPSQGRLPSLRTYKTVG